MAKKDDRTTLRAGDIREPESIIRDDFTKPTFAETEMKLQGTAAYEYNARKTIAKAKTQKKTEYKDKTGHHFVWYRQIYLPILRLRPKGKKLTSKSRKKDRSLLAVILTVFIVAMTGFIASNWESIRPAIVAKSERYAEELVFHEKAANDYDSGAECVGAFLAYVAEGDAPNAMRCLDSYAGMSYFRCETEMKEFVSGKNLDEAYYARTFLRELIDAYDAGSEFVNLRYDIREYSFRAAPNIFDGRHIIHVNMSVVTEDGYQEIKMEIPTVTIGGNYYISYENT